MLPCCRYEQLASTKELTSNSKVLVKEADAKLGPFVALVPVLALANNKTDVIVVIDDRCEYTNEMFKALLTNHIMMSSCVTAHAIARDRPDKAGPALTTRQY